MNCHERIRETAQNKRVEKLFRNEIECMKRNDQNESINSKREPITLFENQEFMYFEDRYQ